MVMTVNQAFSDFMKYTVNLDQSRVADARASRNWLLGKIKSFPENDDSFPFLYNDNHLNYGSFERKTKTRPLNDIDMMVCISANGCYYIETSINDIKIYFPEGCCGRLNSFSSTVVGKENTLSSTVVSKSDVFHIFV